MCQTSKKPDRQTVKSPFLSPQQALTGNLDSTAYESLLVTPCNIHITNHLCTTLLSRGFLFRDQTQAKYPSRWSTTRNGSRKLHHKSLPFHCISTDPSPFLGVTDMGWALPHSPLSLFRTFAFPHVHLSSLLLFFAPPHLPLKHNNVLNNSPAPPEATQHHQQQ